MASGSPRSAPAKLKAANKPQLRLKLMKFSRLSLLASAVVLTIGAATLAIPARAQFEGFENSDQWQQKKQELVQALGLTETQQSQLEALRAEMRSELQGTLTAEQRATLEQMLSSGQNPRSAWQSLNLTDAQRQQIRAAGQEFRQQAQTILTEEQRQQWRQMVQERRGQRNQ